MDIQGELREAWDEVIPADEDRQSDVFAGGINDRDKVHFALGYLSAKRRFGVSKPDRRAELLELWAKVYDDCRACAWGPVAAQKTANEAISAIAKAVQQD